MGATIGSAPPDRSPESGSAPQTKPFATVIVATRDRPETLAACLDSLARLDYPNYEVVVVDNCPATEDSAELVAGLQAAMPWLRYVREDRPGLASAHNCGLAFAGGEILAFTDDDVLVDRGWLTALVDGFERAGNVACVTGLIRPMSLETPAERWAEQAWGHGKGQEARIFDLGAHRPASPLFPYAAGSYGSGANMAFRADVLRELGGFDAAIGTGTRARGGDDLDAFYRVIAAGHALVYEPRAAVLHRHHRDEEALRRQAFGYGAGLTAYLTKIVAGNPRLAITLLPRLPRALLHARAAGRPQHHRAGDGAPAGETAAVARIRGLAIRRYLGMIWGPVAYVWSRWETARRRVPAGGFAVGGPRKATALALALNLDDLSERLCRDLDARDWTNAYLAAAGMSQVMEDYLSGASTLIGRVTRGLAGTRGGALAARASGAGRAARAKTHARAVRWQAEVAQLCLDLAPVVIGQAAPFGAAGWQARADVLRRDLAYLPVRARTDMVRPPSCFHRFDEHPEDAVAFATEAAIRWPATDPVLVLGVRTSGSYLAPLQAAALVAAGFSEVGAATVRPGQRLPHPVAGYLRRVRRGHGRVLVVDDAPASGRTLRQVIDGLGRQRVPARAITLAVPLVPGAEVPTPLAGVDTLPLPWDSWSVVRRLDPERVAADVAQLLGPQIRVVAVHRVEGEPPAGATAQPARGHVEAVYVADLVGPAGQVWSERVVVEGCGVGYFGTGALAINGALGGGAVKVHGIRGGLLYRQWLDPRCSLASLPAADRLELAAPVARVLANRARALALPEDPTPALAGRGTVVETASILLARGFGRAASPVRAMALDRAMGRLVQAPHPAVVDGSTDLEQWFVTGPDRVVKVGRMPGQASRIVSADPVYDLAGVAAAADDPEMEARLRVAFGAALGEHVDEERWLLYLLVQLWDARRRGSLDARAADRLSSLAVQRYLVRRILDDVVCPADGPLCALDLDGVVEHAAYGWPVPTPSSVLALRGLMVHGFRPVPVTGRSVDHVRDLCITFGLPGGAAEYGAVLYERGDEQVIDLVRPAVTDSLRTDLSALAGVDVDAAYRVVVRAAALGAQGRGPLDPALVTDLLAAHDGLAAVRGDGQTDFVPVAVDKGKGVAALASLLGHGPGGGGPATIAGAVGDTASDLPMLEAAQHGFLLGHAPRGVRRAGITTMKHAYQRGLLEAAGGLIGHAPGGCDRCAPPAQERRTRDLLRILAAPEGTTPSVLRSAVSVSVRTWLP